MPQRRRGIAAVSGVSGFYTFELHRWGYNSRLKRGWGHMAQDEPQAGTNGPHHCIATANTITDMIFRYLRARCSAQGGTLSFEDLDDASERFAESVPSGFDLFETIHLRCMRASGSTAAALFTRKALLATLLFECGYHSAQSVFATQTMQFGTSWLRQCFRGLASYIREFVCKDADYQLIGIYVQAAKKLKGKLSGVELLKEPGIQAVLRDCMTPILATAPGMIEGLLDAINQHITGARKPVGPDASKITASELQRFLGLLQNELDLTLKNASGPQ
jgi:hypothetical protein